MQYLGFVAGALTTAAFVPQVWRSVRTRSVNDLSIGMLVLFNLGVSLWIVYGWLLSSLPVVMANIATLVLNVPLLVLKVRSLERKSEFSSSSGDRSPNVTEAPYR